MPYVICKHPVIRMDIMVLQQYWPQMAAIVQRTGCKYDKEDWIELSNNDRFVILRNVNSDHGYKLGELLGLLYSLEGQAKADPDRANLKFYILLKPKKRKEKNNVHKNGQKVHSRGESGTGGASTNDIGHGQNPEPGAGGSWSCSISTSDIRGLEVLEAADDGDN